MTVVGLDVQPNLHFELRGPTTPVNNCETFEVKDGSAFRWRATVGPTVQSPDLRSTPDCSTTRVFDASVGFCPITIKAPNNARVQFTDIPHLQQVVNGQVVYLPINSVIAYTPEALGVVGPSTTIDTTDCLITELNV